MTSFDQWRYVLWKEPSSKTVFNARCIYFSSSQEALRDLNEELEESHLQTEHDLREELDMTNNKKREVSKYFPFQLHPLSVFQSYTIDISL